ncbi:MAG TPA: type II toxin-antitoxin system VapC family toxin [Gaiellaceae bacterium]|nr:type II toxin-antitoxin system VapC family toxin [Gaiellaceae bacterium]
MLVLDASLVVPDCAAGRGFDYLNDRALVAPPFMWAEVRSGLHEAAWRGDVDRATALRAHDLLMAAPIEPRSPAALGTESWRIADELGWARTYDADYVALASILGCRLVTLDKRLRRGADRLGFVVSPAEL